MEAWSLRFNYFEGPEEKLRESLLTLGNGYFASRGALEESRSDHTHYPGTYLNGGYDIAESTVEGMRIRNEDLVNWPNWLCISFRHPGEAWFDVCDVRVIDYHEKLHLKKGYLYRSVRFTDPSGRESVLETQRFVSMENSHVGAIRWSLTPVNWAGPVEVRCWVDGTTRNEGVPRYKKFKDKHYSVVKKSFWGKKYFALTTRSSNSEVKLCQAFSVTCNRASGVQSSDFRQWEQEEALGYEFDVSMEVNKKVMLEKVMALFTSRDSAIVNPEHDSRRLIERLPSFHELLEDHENEWERLWNLCDIDLPGRVRETRLLRLHIFHLLQTVSMNSIELDVGVPARGLHGEAYRGHVFWDEIFIFPFLNFRLPELTRSLLMYRYRRLGEARANAKKNGFSGAMYPWQSASNGEEQSQLIHLNPISGHWIPDLTFKQIHINSAIVFNIWQYFEASGDYIFLSHYGLEVSMEIAKFFGSKMKFNPEKGRYEILDVVGPDEFHTGINNNAYTNYMASWSIKVTVDLFLLMAEYRQEELLRKTRISRSTLSNLYEMARKIYISIGDDGIIEQFEGFRNLEDLDWTKYLRKYGDIQRIDRILESEGDSVTRYKVNKQSDVLMIYFLFSKSEVINQFSWLGYSISEESIRANISYHLSLSTNGSSLSRIVHAWVISRYRPQEAWKWFNLSLEIDVADLQGGTTSEGIHLGAMAGTVDIVQRCFTGIEVKDNILWVNPQIPKEIGTLTLPMHFRQNIFMLTFTEASVIVGVVRTSDHACEIGVLGKVYHVSKGQEVVIPLGPDPTEGNTYVQ